MCGFDTTPDPYVSLCISQNLVFRFHFFFTRPHVFDNILNLYIHNSQGTHNMYKDFRDTSLVGAVIQLYSEMASRHRARNRSIQVIRVEEISASDCRRDNVTQFHNTAIKFPLAHRIPRASNAQVRTTFKANRPTTFFS